MANNVEIISSNLVGMANSRGHSTQDLTPWDLRLLLIDPIQKGLLFNNPNRSQQSALVLTDHLKRSLSRTLDFFPSLSGRLVRLRNEDGTASFFIACNDAGAEFTHAAAAAVSVSDILIPRYIPEVVSSFFTLNEMQNHEGVSKPLLGVQVTQLADGLFVGITANHVAVDGTSFWHFVNSWSEISRGDTDTISKLPVFERWFPGNVDQDQRMIKVPDFDPTTVQNIFKVNAAATLVDRIFSFSNDSLTELKQKAKSEVGCRDEKISTLQVLSAHLWRSIVRSRQQHSTSENSQEHSLILLVDARGRIPLQDGYFGNAIYTVKTVIQRLQLLQNGLGFSAGLVNQLVSQQTSEAAIKFVEEWANAPDLTRKGTIEFVITSSPRFDVYGCDFGWGKPVTVRSGKAQKYDGRMTLFPGPEPGSIEVQVCSTPETLMAMEDDTEFMEFITI